MYGACVNGAAICNGITDCVDNSDELNEKCPGHWNITGSCGANKFECLPNVCIEMDKVCDGKSQCENGMDESVLACGSFHCPTYAFHCAYGACIDKKLHCDGNIDCMDGSDETCINEKQIHSSPSPLPVRQGTYFIETSTPTAFTNITTTTTEMQPEEGACKLKLSKHLKAYYVNEPEPILLEFIPNGHQIEYSCDKPYSMPMDPRTENDCLDGDWMNPVIPKCLMFCTTEEFDHFSIHFSCNHNDITKKCNELVESGTLVTVECATEYKKTTREYISSTFKCRQDGSWSSSPATYKDRCKQICGSVNSNVRTQILIKGGYPINIVNYPWMAAIFSDTRKSGDFEQMCGGTVISAFTIISAAHCFWDTHTGFPHNQQHFRIGVGKSNRNFSTESEHKEAQLLKVLRIEIPEGYTDSKDYYHTDIAVIIVSGHIKFGEYVKPICLNLEAEFQDTHMDTGLQGYLAGWGKTGMSEKDSESKQLKLLNIRSISFKECRNQTTELFQKYITNDKFCGGNEMEGNACEGDSGGGFILKGNNNQYFLHGIVSNGPDRQGSCDITKATAFTNVLSHTKNLKYYVKYEND